MNKEEETVTSKLSLPIKKQASSLRLMELLEAILLKLALLKELPRMIWMNMWSPSEL